MSFLRFIVCCLLSHVKVICFLPVGYQRELTYQRQDGAFSTFGNRDNAGSTWYSCRTAVVLISNFVIVMSYSCTAYQ